MLYATLILCTGFFLCVSSQEPIKISIYYESLCKDSCDFLTKQFAPFYTPISSEVIIEFVPYGKATHNLINKSWKFQCQHGPKECYGNLMQACILAQTNDQDLRVSLITCIMASPAPASNTSMKKCTGANGMSWEELKKCAKSRKGRSLLVKYGIRTNTILPNIRYIPSIVYNDIYNEDLQNKSMAHFKDVILRLITERNRRTHWLYE